MPFDFSAFRPRPEAKPELGGSAMVDPRGGINPGGIMPPKPGGFLSPMVGGGLPPAPPPMSMAPKPPMMGKPMPPRPMGMAPRGMPAPQPGRLGMKRRMGMF